MKSNTEFGSMLRAWTITFVLVLSIFLPVVSAVGDESHWLKYRYDDICSGNSLLTSNIVEPKVKWSFLTGDIVKSPPTIGDINNDGEMEVVFGSNDQHLYALDRFGNLLWNFPVIGSIVNSPTIGDVDGDGLNEIVFGGYYRSTGDPNLYVLNGEDGSLLWQFESANIGGDERGFQASALLFDINNDEIKDVLIGSMDYYFYAFNGPDGALIWSSEEFPHFVRASSPIGDIDRDGDLEIVVVDNEANVRMYTAFTGSLKWEIDIGHGVEATPVLADVKGDGYNEIILFTIGGLNTSGDAVVLNHDGTELWRSDVHTYFYTSPTILDIDGDGLVDIIGGDTDDHTIVAYKGTDGSILWETTLPDSSWSQAPLVTADIDGDGIIEVIAGANPNLYCLSTEDGTIKWTFETSGHIWGQPAIADLEQDGLAEVIFGCYDNYLYVLENTYEPPVADAGENQMVSEGDVVFVDGSNSIGSTGHMVRDPSVVALWHMNEGSGNVIYDETDNHHDGTIYGVTWTSNGRFGNALSFDGIDDYIEIKPSDQIFGDNPDEWSYLLWFNLTQGFGNMSFISDYNFNDPNAPGYPSGDSNLSINLDMDYSEFWDKYFIGSDLHCKIGTHGHGFGHGIKISYNDYNWHLAVVTVSKIDKYSRLYLDYDWGYSWFPLDDIGPYGDYFDGSMLRIGACFYRSICNYFKGDIDEVVLFNRALTAQEIRDYFESGKEYSPVMYDIPAEIISYEWDFESDGIYDYQETQNNAPDGSFDGKTTHVYGDDGDFIVTLRITDDHNQSDTDTCNITVLNVDPTVTIESAIMDVEIGLRVAGRKFNDVGMTLFEEGSAIGYVSIERLPGSPNDQMAWIPVTLDMTKTYSATVTYTPEDPPKIGGNPVWIYLKFEDGSEEKIHHTFNVQQSKKRDSEHWNHVEPWEVDLKTLLIGHPYEVISHITDPGSDDETLTYRYSSQIITIEYLNNPPNPDPYPSPEVNPVDVFDSTSINYEGPDTLTLTVIDDDGGTLIAVIDLN